MDDGRGAAIGFDLDVLKRSCNGFSEISKPSIVSLHKDPTILKQSREKLYIR